MLHLIQRCTIMNKFGRFSGRISAETCQKIDCFGSKSPKIAKPLASGSWKLRFQTLFRLNDYWLENVQDPTSIESTG